ncbi:MAG: autotransporter-associated beta strand repeat-containing protein [Verrucomicrobia bacterium]|nr:autotransporter-associated beta strand repeat-containing protein [Verrucomicrobiota bacterium]
MKYNSASLFLAVSSLLSPLAKAVDYSWNGAANGTWNLTNTNWATGDTDPWNATNGILNLATFNTASLAATVNGTVYANGIKFDAAGSLSGGTISLGGTSPTITTNANASIGSVVTGGSLTKSGVGTLALGGSNTYTGTTTINSGVISVASLAANGTNSGIGAGTDVTLNGGTLRYTGGNNGSDAGAKFNRNISVGAGGGTIDVGGTGFLFYAGTLTGSGTLKIIDGSGDANNRQLLVTGNSPLFSGNIEIGNGSANSGWVQYRSAAASPFGSGTVTIMTGGVLSSDSGSGNPASLANNIVLSGGTLASQSVGTNYTGSVTANTGTISSFSTGTSNIVLSGTLLGNGALQKSGGSWSVELRGDNSGFNGTYSHTADGATIFYTANSASAAASWNIPSGSNGAARFMAAAANGTYKLGALSGTTGRIENLNASSGNSIFEIGALNTDTTFAGTVQNGGGGTVGIQKVGSGKLTLSGSVASYTGNTTVENGQLYFNFASDLNSATVNNNASVTFYRGGNGSANIYSKLSGTGTWTVDGPGGGDQWSNRVILRGTGSDNTGTLSVINSGKLWSQLTATNNPIGDTADVSIATSAVFNLYGPAGRKETIGGLQGSGTVDFSDGGAGKALTLEVGGGDKNGNFSGVIKNSGGSSGPTVLSLSKIGGGHQILSGNNSYSGTTTVSNGTLTAGHANAFGTGSINVTGGTLALGSNSVTNAITLNGGKLTGSGVSLSNVTVGSDSFITGSFTGTLNTGTNPARAINTTGGATFQNLTGQATFSGGLVTLTGSHTPGNSPGTQTFNDGLSYADNSSLTLEIAADGSAWDFLNITGGSLTFGNNVSLTLGLFGTADYSTSFWDLDHTFTLVSSNALTGDFTGVNNLLGDAPAEGSWTYGWAGNDYQASWTAVPEPGAALLGGLGSLFLLRRRRHG